MIMWNKVTWYSRFGAIILFLGIVPVLTFYIGTQYQATLDTFPAPTPVFGTIHAMDNDMLKKPAGTMGDIGIGEDAMFEAKAKKLPDMDSAITLSRSVAEKDYAYKNVEEVGVDLWKVTWSISETDSHPSNEMFITVNTKLHTIVSITKAHS